MTYEPISIIEILRYGFSRRTHGCWLPPILGNPQYVNHMFFALLSSLSLTALDSHHASYAPCPRHARSIYVGLQQMTVAMRQGWGSGNGTQKRVVVSNISHWFKVLPRSVVGLAETLKCHDGTFQAMVQF